MKFVKKKSTNIRSSTSSDVCAFFTNFIDIIDLFYASYFSLTTKKIGLKKKNGFYGWNLEKKHKLLMLSFLIYTL